MSLSVYVEGSRDTSAAGVKRLASLIAARYGLAAADLEKRLATGRFRVKANVDAATARAFASDLEALGALCSIVEAEVSGPVRGLKGIPALEPSAAAAGAPADPSAARVLTPNSARTITASAVPPPQARTASATAPAAATAAAPPAGARPLTGSSAALRPSTGLAAATSVREPDSSSLNPPTLRSSTGLSAATVRPPHEGSGGQGGPGGPGRAAAPDALNPPTLRGSSGLSAATVRPAGHEPGQGDALTTPTLLGLSSSSRTPAQSMQPLASRTTTLPFAGLSQRPGPSTAPPNGAPTTSGLAAALADATYSSSGGLGALDGASFSLSTLDGQDDAEPSAAVRAGATSAARAASSSAAGEASGASPYSSSHASSSYASSYASTYASMGRADDDEPPDYDTASSYTPTLAFDEPPAPPAPSYESYPPRRPGTGRTSTPLRPATSSGLPSLSARDTGSVPALRPSSSAVGPRPGQAAPSAPPGPPAPRIDLFAPPPEAGPAQIHLAEESPRQRASSLAPPRPGPEGAPMVAPAIASPFVPRAGSDAASARRLRDRLRLVFAAGVLVAVVVGFVPAHLIAKSRERAAFERIDNRARIAQSEISSMDEWNALDDVRTALLRQKRAAQQEIALLSVLLWVGVTGALSFAWFRFGVLRFDPRRQEEGEDYKA